VELQNPGGKGKPSSKKASQVISFKNGCDKSRNKGQIQEERTKKERELS